MPRRYIHPKSLIKRINREYLLVARRYGVKIMINVYGEKRIKKKRYLDASVSVDTDEDMLKILKKVGIKFSKKEERGLFSPSVLAHLLREEGIEEIPIGISKKKDRILRIPWPSRILTDSPWIATILSLFSTSVVWIDYLGLPDYTLEIFEEVEGFPVELIPTGAREDLARVIAKKTIGMRYVSEISRFLREGSKGLEEDEEIAMIGPEQSALSELVIWKILSFKEKPSSNKLYIDITGASKFSFMIAGTAALLSNIDTIILSAPHYDKDLEPLIRERNGVVYVLPDIPEEEELPFNTIISDRKGMITYRTRINGYNIYYNEEYISIINLIKEVIRG